MNNNLSLFMNKREGNGISCNTGRNISSYNVTASTAGQTRDCTDPWTFMQILSNNRIRPCCFSEVEIGSVKGEGGIEGALNSEAAVHLRKGLLTGNLDEYCSICSYRPMIDVPVFQRKIRRFIRFRVVVSFLSKKCMSRIHIPAWLYNLIRAYN